MTERFMLYQLGMRGYAIGGAVFPDYKFDRFAADTQREYLNMADLGTGRLAHSVLNSKLYINLADPAALICKVPDIWPPRSLHVSYYLLGFVPFWKTCSIVLNFNFLL